MHLCTTYICVSSTKLDIVRESRTNNFLTAENFDTCLICPKGENSITHYSVIETIVAALVDHLLWKMSFPYQQAIDPTSLSLQSYFGLY